MNAQTSIREIRTVYVERVLPSGTGFGVTSDVDAEGVFLPAHILCEANGTNNKANNQDMIGQEVAFEVLPNIPSARDRTPLRAIRVIEDAKPQADEATILEALRELRFPATRSELCETLNSNGLDTQAAQSHLEDLLRDGSIVQMIVKTGPEKIAATYWALAAPGVVETPGQLDLTEEYAEGEKAE